MLVGLIPFAAPTEPTVSVVAESLKTNEAAFAASVFTAFGRVNDAEPTA